jgi:hypothetical protein
MKLKPQDVLSFVHSVTGEQTHGREDEGNHREWRKPMQLDRVTITGADDSIEVARLTELSEEFPFVEWGILYSIKQCGHSRFPSARWLDCLKIAADCYPKMQFSLHLCGQIVRSLFSDPLSRAYLPPERTSIFQRVQLNFHGDAHGTTPEQREQIAANLDQWSNEEPRKQFIFQADGTNDDLLGDVFGTNFSPVFDGVVLFDCSHGAGVSPDSWPTPIYMETDADYTYHGYAGGLGPDNLKAELHRIDAVANCRVWVDMETKIRSADDKQFDLSKVRQCLEICKPWMKTKAVAST